MRKFTFPLVDPDRKYSEYVTLKLKYSSIPHWQWW